MKKKRSLLPIAIARQFKGKKRQLPLLGVAAGLLIFVYFYIFFNLPSPYSLKNYTTVPLSTQILDRKGRLLYEVYNEENRTPVLLKDLPPYVAQATIAIEDKDFYRHSGVSLIGGILRAARETLFHNSLQGGSTITQQLIKSALLTPERTIRRKVREIILALWTEQIFSKEEILELYLNQVPYGGASYGVEVASRSLFGKHAKELTIAQAALLAGLPQAPSLYSPHSNPDLARARRDEVLKKMFEQKYITRDQYESAKSQKLVVKPPATNIKAPHFVFYVKGELEKQFGATTIEEGGLTVTTTLDLDIQQEAEKILKEELETVKNLNVSNGAILVTRPPTGEILAMVGSVDYFATPSGSFNVTTALRQPGSSIKPINYAIGIERRLVTAASVFLDVPTCFNPAGAPKQYCPVNYDGRFHGPTQLRFALANSYNIPAVKMLGINGVENFVASAAAYGITSFKDPSRYGLSLTLGGGEIRMTEMSTAFSAFANRGAIRLMQGILKVEDRNKKVITEFKDANYVPDVRKSLDYPKFLAIGGKQATSRETAFLISHILSDNAARAAAFGSSSQLVVPAHTVAVKTGTTDDKRDNWTIGYTPNFLTTVWVGNNDNTPMNPYLTSGVTGAAPIWNRVMRYLLKSQPDLKPLRPDTVVGRQVCTDTGSSPQKVGDAFNCPTRFEYLIKGTETKGLIVERKKVWVTKDSDKLARPGQENTEEKEKTIIRDAYSEFCADCAGDQLKPSPTPTP